MPGSQREGTRPVGRDVSLDGMRGVAAVVVALFHFACAFEPGWTPDTSDHPAWWVDTPLHLVLHGSLAVSVFFVLSGYVIASTAGRTPLRVLLPLRYLRLSLPALASVALSWLLLLAFPGVGWKLYGALPHQWLRYSHLLGVPPLADGVRDAFWGMYANPGSRWNNVLWTMRLELLGSALVYAYQALPRSAPLRSAALAAGAALCLYRPIMSCFMVGLCLCEASRSRTVAVRRPRAWLAAGLLLGFPGLGFAARHGVGFLPAALSPGNRDGFVLAAAASCIVVAALSPGAVRDALSMRWATWLGKVSFPLYLVHVPVALTVGAAAYLAAPPGLGTLAALAAAVPVSVALAVAGERWVDAPLVGALRRARRRLSGARGRLGRVPDAGVAPDAHAVADVVSVPSAHGPVGPAPGAARLRMA